MENKSLHGLVTDKEWKIKTCMVWLSTKNGWGGWCSKCKTFKIVRGFPFSKNLPKNKLKINLKEIVLPMQTWKIGK